ncbi:MAG: type VI secretion system membrane subunit TssM [Neisseriaceae bacterium]|nr:MAG: type VI secretion system membrane subunit TssM [Neisseriaceae bacterium]
MVLFRRTIIIIFAFILCAVIWYIGPIVAVGKYHPFAAVWIRVFLIAVILFTVFWPITVMIISFLLRYFLKPFKQKPKQKKELDIVTSRFQDTILTLKVSSLTDKKSKLQTIADFITKPYLEDRPWFLMIGAPSVGKTSSLSNSGENFLHSEHYGLEPTSNIGPTDVYNSWISDRAVYFDTNPEWIKLDGQREESVNHIKTFFKLVKKYRDSGLDGILLVIDSEWLRKVSVNELKSYADTLRARLLEITKILAQDLPVSLLITKIDLLPGAKEFMYMFNDEIIDNGFGLSAPPIRIDGRDTDYFDIFSTRYDEWIVKLTDYLLEVLHESLDNQTRSQLFDFVESISSLKKTILSLVEQIFPSHPTGYSGYLHDIWFGSAISLQIGNDEYDTKYLGKLYYPALTRQVESRGILDNLTATKKVKFNRRKAFKYAGIGLLAIVGMFILVMKYSKEVDYISYVAAKFKHTKNIIKEVPLSSKAGDELVYAYEQLGYINSQLNGSQEGHFNFQDDKINPYIEHTFINETLERAYHNHLLKFFWPAVTNYITDQLAKNIKTNSQEVYDTLRMYQMLVKPERRNSEDLINWFMSQWDSFAPSGYTGKDKKIFSFHLKSLFDDKFPDDSPVFNPNNSLVNIAMQKARNTPTTLRVIKKLKDMSLPPNIRDISLSIAAGNNASLMLQHKDGRSVVDMSIPAFYTRGAYHDLFLENIDKTIQSVIEELSWVLNDDLARTSPKLSTIGYKQKLKEDVIQYYLIEFTDQWNKFINNITVRPVKNLEDAAFLSKQLADPSSPIVNFIRFVSRELNLTGTEDGYAGDWFKRTVSGLQQNRKKIIGEISGERTQYRLSPEKLVEDQFRSLLDIGNKIVRVDDLNGNPVSKLFEDVYNLIYPLSLVVKNDPTAPHQEESVFGQIKGRALTLPDPLKSILLDLVDGSQSHAIQEIKTTINNKVTGVFSEICHGTIMSKYPFNKNSQNDISVSDFNRIFAPSGELEHFFKENNIEELIQQQTYGNSQTNYIDPKIARAYNNFLKIKNSFFIGGNELKMTFDVKPVALSSNVFQADLDIDGQKIRYSHGYPTTTRVVWPGPNNGNLIKLTLQTNDGAIKIVNFSGPWALFRFYDKSKVIKSGVGYRVISYVLDGKYSINLEIRSDMSNFPIWDNAIQRFSCPH